ncbi:MAG TPA: transporter substrate-binding domain-containing protein [Methylomicrobium sp.]|nr:transporter substrate-binding domain-containing protein [Methylomicrobium sp.]
MAGGKWVKKKIAVREHPRKLGRSGCSQQNTKRRFEMNGRIKQGKWLIFLVVTAVILSIGAGSEAKDWKKVRIGTEGAYAPWNFMDASGKLAGFEIDLGNELCRRMNVECEWVAQEWSGIIPGLNAGKYDLIMASFGLTEKRKDVLSFSNFYAYQSSKFAVLKSNPLAKSVQDSNAMVDLDNMNPESQKAIDELKKALSGKAIGAQTGTNQFRFLDAYFKDIAEIRDYKTAEQTDLDLSAGRIDALLVSTTYLKPLMATDKGKDLALIGPFFRGKYFPIGNAAVFRKDQDKELVQMFNVALEAAIKDGTVSKLSLKWFKYDVMEKPKGN